MIYVCDALRREARRSYSLLGYALEEPVVALPHLSTSTATKREVANPRFGLRNKIIIIALAVPFFSSLS